MAPLLSFRQLSIGQGRTLVEGLSCTIKPGEIICLLGANGSGKSTLLRTLLGVIPARAGQIELLGREISNWPRAQLASVVAYVAQSPSALAPFTVKDVVLMGRRCRLGPFQSPSRSDLEQTSTCLEQLGIGHLRSRRFGELSGGERQLVAIARALAQEPALILMDEPTASLDFGNQARVLSVVDRLRHLGKAILMSTHQPDQALKIADRALLLQADRSWEMAAPEQALQPKRLAALYAIEAELAQQFLPGR